MRIFREGVGHSATCPSGKQKGPADLTGLVVTDAYSPGYRRTLLHCTQFLLWLIAAILSCMWLASIVWTIAYGTYSSGITLLPHCVRIAHHPDSRTFTVDGGVTGFYMLRANHISRKHTRWIPSINRPFATMPEYVTVTVPLWIPLSGALLLASLARADLRKHRIGFRVCCGYDLRGNTSRVCSECGRPLESQETRVCHGFPDRVQS